MRRPPTFLYCIELVGPPVAKVGISQEPRKRASAFAAHCPFTIAFRRVLRFRRPEDAAAHERHIIRNAASHRERGEWLKLDDRLDALLSACPADDVTEDFAGDLASGRPRSVLACTKNRNRLALQVGAQAAAATRYSGGEAGYSAAVVRARLSEGFGVEDISVMDGIPEAFSWCVVHQLEDRGTLRNLLGARAP